MKAFEEVKEEMNSMNKQLALKKKELNQLNADIKAKKQALTDLETQLASLGDKAELQKRIEELEKENAELKEKLKNGGASEEELKKT